MLSLSGEELGYGGGSQGGPHAEQRRLVGCGDDHDRALPAFDAKRIFKEFANLAAAFADQADHCHVGFRVAGHHAN